MSSSPIVSVSFSVVPIVSVPATAMITVPIIPFTPIVIPPVMTRRAQAPAPAAAHPVAAIPPKELPPQIPPDQFDVHEIAVSASVAVVLLELAAGGLAEVGDRGEIGYDRATVVEPPLESLQGGGGVVLLLELDVDVADHVVREVVANVEALDLAELAELLEDVLVEVLEVLLDLARVDRLALGVHSGGDHVRPLVHVGEKQRRRDRRSVMEAGAPVAVAARADLEVEGAVDAVLLGAEDRSQVLRHGLYVVVSRFFFLFFPRFSLWKLGGMEP